MIRRKSLLVMLFLALAAALAAETAVAAPKLKIDSTHFDFGYTPEGLPVVHKYRAYNVGTDTLRINRVRPSCGCTSVPLTKKILPPGDSTDLELRFDTKRFKGQIAKTAAVESNDSTQPDLQLHFTARVGLWEGVIVTNHSQIYLDTLGKTEQTITLKNTSIAPYKISVASPVADYMVMELSAMEIPGKGEVALTFRSTPKTPIGEYNTSVTLHFDGPQPQNVSIPIYGIGYLP